MIKKLLMYFIIIQMIGASFITRSFAIEDTRINCEIKRSVLDNIIIDEKPGIDLRITIPSDSTDKYQMKLITDYNTVEMVPIENTGTEQNLHFEFAVKEEGYHKLKAELIKNGLLYNSYEFEQYYIISVGNDGYSERGYCVHYSQGKSTELDAEMLKAGGNTVVRDDISWHMVEKEKGVYDFSSYDKTVALLTENGLDILFILGAYGLGNELYLDENGSRVMRTPEQIEAFKKFCVEAVKRYPQVRKWEILNESNFTLTGEEYFNIVYPVAKALKEYDPDLTIYAGGLAQSDAKAFVNGFYNEQLYPYIDGLSDHYYAHNRYADNTGFFTQVDNLTEIQKREGGWKEYAITETGYATGVSTDQVPEIKQASENVKKAVLCDWLDIKYMSFYDFKNDGYNLDEREDTFGAVDINSIPKASYHTVKQYQNETNKAIYVGKVHLHNKLSAHLYAANDDYFMIVWAKNTFPNMSILYDNDISVQYTFPDNVTIENMYGTYIPGNILTATYEPSYVHGLSKEFCLNAIRANTENDIFDELRMDANKYGYSIQNIESAYNNIFIASDYSAVEQYVSECYIMAKTIVKDFLNNNIKISEKEFSQLLYSIVTVSNKGAKLALMMETASEIEVDLLDKYDLLKTTPSIAVNKKVPYINEPYYFGKKLIDKFSEYSEGERVLKTSGERFELNSDNKMVVRGSATVNDVLVRIEDSNGNPTYINLIPTDEEGNYYFEYDVDMPYGNYTIKINDGNVSSTDILYAKDEEYVSVEDKVYSINSFQAKKLLEIYESMLGWADIKYSYLNPEVKAITWQDTKVVNVTGVISQVPWVDSSNVDLTVYDKITNNIIHTDSTNTDSNGNYRFKFNHNGNLDDVYVKVCQGDLVVDNVDVRQADESELIYGSMELVENADVVKVLLDLKNYFGLTDRSVQVLVAYYDTSNRLVSCAVEDIKDITAEELKQEYTFPKKDMAAKIQVFAWNSLEAMSPYAEALLIE